MRTITKDWANRLRMAGLACLIGMGSSVTAQAQATIGLYEQARFTLGTSSTNSYGTNPASVAWSGGKLYVAGQNGSGATANSGIVEILNTSATGIVTGSQSAAFGVISTPSTRGYTGV